MNYVNIEIRGHTFYCENNIGERYDFFEPREHYRINKKEANAFVPEGHKLIDIKRTSKLLTVDYNELLNIAN